MKRSQDIEVTRMALEIQSLQSRLGFYTEKLENSVPREEYEAKEAENAALKRELASLREIHGQELSDFRAKHAAELSAMQDKLNEYQEAQALLQTENVDLKTLIEFWRSHQFGASSETMTDMMDKVVGKLPTGKTAFMYSLVESCRMNDLDFGHYIETVLIRIQDGDTDFHGMLPNVIVLPETAGNASVA